MERSLSDPKLGEVRAVLERLQTFAADPDSTQPPHEASNGAAFNGHATSAHQSGAHEPGVHRSGEYESGSGELESFSDELGGGLEYPHYTRPAEFRGWRVPEVLLSGDHARIESWRKEHVR